MSVGTLDGEKSQAVYKVRASSPTPQNTANIHSTTTVKYYSPTTSLCIIRVAREHIRTAWTGLTFVNNIAGQPCIPRVVAVSGTIKKLHFAAIRYSREVTALYLAHTLRTLGEPFPLFRIPVVY
jgi:RNase P/RNase MRP subunit POP5